MLYFYGEGMNQSNHFHGALWIRQIYKQEQESGQPEIFFHLRNCLQTYKYHQNRGNRCIVGKQSENNKSTEQKENTKQFKSSYNQIDLDIPRTFPTHAFFSKPSSLGQQELRRVLSAYVSWEMEIFNHNNKDQNNQPYNIISNRCGYVQGMNMIAGHILKHMNEFHTFHLFSHLMV